MKKIFLMVVCHFLLVACTTNKNITISDDHSKMGLPITLPKGAVVSTRDSIERYVDKTFPGYRKYQLYYNPNLPSDEYVTTYLVLKSNEALIIEGPLDHSNDYWDMDENGNKIYVSTENRMELFSSKQMNGENKVVIAEVRNIDGVAFHWVETKSATDNENHFIVFETPISEEFMKNGIRGYYYFKNTDREASLQRLEDILGSIYKEGK